MGPHNKSHKRSPSEDSREERRKKKKSRSKSKKKSKKHREPSSSDSSSSSDSVPKKKQKKCKTKKKEKAESSTDIPIELMEKSRAMAPMTKEEWEKRQSVVRRVYDESTGRHRLIKGDGEVIEEIVSRDRHKSINEQATRGDGDFFQKKMLLKK